MSTTSERTSAAVVLSTLGLAALAWVVAIRQMDTMGMVGGLGSFAFFAGLWVSMMAAMMLPGVIPAVARHARRTSATAVPAFIGSYLAVWAVVGVAIYGLYHVHGSVAAGVVVIAAGVYELTPTKRAFRRRCQEDARGGLDYGLRCVGSSIGLMLMLVALGLMSIGWMVVIALVVVAQKLVPPRPAMDVAVAVAMVGLGIAILTPGSVPGITPPM
jgi:predicted metal-binding membrane protein